MGDIGGRGLGPAGGNGVEVGGFESLDVAGVVLLGDFDGAVAEPALGLVDAILHGDLAAGIFPEFVIGFPGFPAELPEPGADEARDVVVAVGCGAGEDVIGGRRRDAGAPRVPTFGLDAAMQSGEPGIEGADLDKAGAVFYGDVIGAVIQDGVTLASGPPVPASLAELADAEAEGELVADGQVKVAIGDLVPGGKGSLQDGVGRGIEPGGGEFAEFEGFAGGKEGLEGRMIQVGGAVGGEGFGGEEAFSLDPTAVGAAFEAGFLRLLRSGEGGAASDGEPGLGHGGVYLADTQLKFRGGRTGVFGGRFRAGYAADGREIGSAEELAEGVDVLDAGGFFGIQGRGGVDGDQLGDGAGNGGAEFRAVELRIVAAHNGFLNLLGFGAGMFLRQFTVVGFKAAGVADFLEGEPEIIVAFFVTWGAGGQFAAIVGAFVEAEAFAGELGFRRLDWAVRINGWLDCWIHEVCWFPPLDQYAGRGQT